MLQTYDLPRNLYERHSWVIRWRVARLRCLHPKEDIHPYFSNYDKRTGLSLSTGFDSALSKLSAIKAQISIAERKEKEYIEYQCVNNLFFDELTDGQQLRFREKLRMKKENIQRWSNKSVQRWKLYLHDLLRIFPTNFNYAFET